MYLEGVSSVTNLLFMKPTLPLFICYVFLISKCNLSDFYLIEVGEQVLLEYENMTSRGNVVL